MKKLLVINSSPGLSHSYSRKLVKAFSDHFTQKVDNAEVTTRDLARQPPPHLDEATIAAFYTPIEQLRDDQKEILSLSDDLITELEGADVVVIGAPMHNFSVPSVSKLISTMLPGSGAPFTTRKMVPKVYCRGKKSLF